MILLIDNYDSFTYNLYQMIGSLYPSITVIRNDEKTVEEIEPMRPEAIVLSPGPGRPDQAGICEELVRKCAGSVPILGICLGHQAICEAEGGSVTYAAKLMHGKQSEISIDHESPLYRGLPETITVGRYHSLAADPQKLPDTLKVTGWSKDHEIMSAEDPDRRLFGIQYHPESILTPEGGIILKNFLKTANVI